MIRGILISSCAFFIAAGPALSDVATETVKSLSAPDTIETRAGRLDFRDGVPTEATARKIYDTWISPARSTSTTTASAVRPRSPLSRASKRLAPDQAMSLSSRI